MSFDTLSRSLKILGRYGFLAFYNDLNAHSEEKIQEVVLTSNPITIENVSIKLKGEFISLLYTKARTFPKSQIILSTKVQRALEVNHGKIIPILFPPLVLGWIRPWP